MVNTFQFLKIGLNYCGQGNLCVNMEDRKPVSKTIKRRFRSHFGTTPALCAYLWDRIDKLSLPAGAKWYHLLWALLFLKLYATEEVLSGMVGGVDEKTYRRWTWEILRALSELKDKVVSSYIFFIQSFISCSHTCNSIYGKDTF